MSEMIAYLNTPASNTSRLRYVAYSFLKVLVIVGTVTIRSTTEEPHEKQPTETDHAVI